MTGTVKALEWREHNGRHFADSHGMAYEVAHFDVHGWSLNINGKPQWIACGKLVAAKDTAQAHFKNHILSALTASASEPAPSFQARVQPWMMACFGEEISNDRVERGDRLLEEVFELLQSGGYDPARVLSLRDYVWSREVGEPSQEAGGVQVTMAAYCLAHGLDMHEAGETELARIWTKVETIRAKQAAKPKHSPLPVPTPDGAVEAHVETVAALLLGSVNAPEQAIYRVARQIVGALSHPADGMSAQGTVEPEGWRLVLERGNWEMLERLRELIEGDTTFDVVADALEYVLSASPKCQAEDEEVAPAKRQGVTVQELVDIEASLDDAVRYLVDMAGAKPDPGSTQNCRAHIEQARFYARRLYALQAGEADGWQPIATAPTDDAGRLARELIKFRPLYLKPVPTPDGAVEALRELHRHEHALLGEMNRDKSRDGQEAANWQGGKVNGIATAISTLSAALSHPADGWRGMSSAPKDGSRILTVRRFGDNLCEAAIVRWSQDESEWWDDDADQFAYPDLWMPLAAPLDAKAERE